MSENTKPRVSILTGQKACPIESLEAATVNRRSSPGASRLVMDIMRKADRSLACPVLPPVTSSPHGTHRRTPCSRQGRGLRCLWHSVRRAFRGRAARGAGRARCGAALRDLARQAARIFLGAVLGGAVRAVLVPDGTGPRLRLRPLPRGGSFRQASSPRSLPDP